MSKNQYVLLTGAKNNAGDFLIKYRVQNLLHQLRPDRELVDMNAWEPIDQKKLEIINNSKALLLAGGPALRPSMYPGIYPLLEDLDKIKVPIILFGVGWKSQKGDWEDIYKYNLQPSTLELLDKISSSPFYSSVRDYHSMHVLQNAGFDKVLMTGCPALYDMDHIGSKFSASENVNTIGFSLGVGHAKSAEMEQIVKKIILKIRDQFPDCNLQVLFHHSIDPQQYEEAYAQKNKLLRKNIEFAEWLDENEVSYKDISGSAQNLIESYNNIDFHIGFRVHAHIFMSSISKPSILISEDGRGKALRSVLGGVVLDGFKWRKNGITSSFLNKVLMKFNIVAHAPGVDTSLPDITGKTINWEVQNEYPRLSTVRDSINAHYTVMKKFINQLP